MLMSKEEPASTIQHIAILPSEARYADQMEALMALVYNLDPRDPENMTFNADHFCQHLVAFPEGQFVAVDRRTDTVVGLTVSMRINHHPNHPLMTAWWELIGDGTLSTHVPDGEWMYGVESAVHPDYRGYGVGKRLTQARTRVMKQLNLRGMVAGSAIIDYHKVVDTVPVDEYVADVIAGKRFDTNLSKQMKMGFKPLHIIPNYLQDWDCCGYGVEMVIPNTDYRQPRRVVRWQHAPYRPAMQAGL
ncbi:MAG: GNAT family N-acetyltransferase [Anaerolineae bacterium]